VTATAPGGVPMVRHSRGFGPDPGPSLILMTNDERGAAAFAEGVLVETARGLLADQPEIAETYRQQADILRSMLDRVCR
jgi:hypothetical protein